jgi:hypothetical protein
VDIGRCVMVDVTSANEIEAAISFSLGISDRTLFSTTCHYILSALHENIIISDDPLRTKFFKVKIQLIHSSLTQS